VSKKTQEQKSKTEQVEHSDPLDFPAGLPGFEEHNRFVLESRADMRPFLWLRSLSDPDIALPVISCLLLKKQAPIHISNEELQLIGSPSQDDIASYFILRVDAKEGTITANTRAPVLINAKTMQGRQVILDREDLRVDEPLANIASSREEE